MVCWINWESLIKQSVILPHVSVLELWPAFTKNGRSVSATCLSSLWNRTPTAGDEPDMTNDCLSRPVEVSLTLVVSVAQYRYCATLSWPWEKHWSRRVMCSEAFVAWEPRWLMMCLMNILTATQRTLCVCVQCRLRRSFFIVSVSRPASSFFNRRSWQILNGLLWNFAAGVHVTLRINLSPAAIIRSKCLFV